MSVGTSVGVSVGTSVGVSVGTSVGVSVGTAVGVSVGIAVGVSVGTSVGTSVGASVGTTVGTSVGVAVGRAVLIGRVGLGTGVRVRVGNWVLVGKGVRVGTSVRVGRDGEPAEGGMGGMAIELPAAVGIGLPTPAGIFPLSGVSVGRRTSNEVGVRAACGAVSNAALVGVASSDAISEACTCSAIRSRTVSLITALLTGGISATRTISGSAL